MLKKSIAFYAFFAALVLSASPIAKIPATAVISGYANVSEVINFPMIKQALATKPMPAGLTVEDFNGKIAVGVTFGKPASKENMRFDVVFTTAKPVAAKFFALLSEKALAQGAKKTKVGGKPAVADKTARVILVSPKEIIMQVKKGKVKFANLKKGKNLLSKAPEVKTASGVLLVDIVTVAANFKEALPAEAQAQIGSQKYVTGSAKLGADGAVSLKMRATYADAASCQNGLTAFNQQKEQFKQNPMAAAIVEKFTAAAKDNDLIISGKFSAEEVQGLIAQAMMMAMSMQQQQQQKAVPAAPAPAVK